MKICFLISLILHVIFFFSLYRKNEVEYKKDKVNTYYSVETINESSLNLDKEDDLVVVKDNLPKSKDHDIDDKNNSFDRKDDISMDVENEVVKDEKVNNEIIKESLRVDKILTIQKEKQKKLKRKYQKKANRELDNKNNNFIRNILEEKRKVKIEKVRKQREIEEEKRRKEEENIKRIKSEEKKKMEIEALKLKKITYAMSIKNKIYSNWIEKYGEVGWECEIHVSQNKKGYIESFRFGSLCKNNESFKNTIREAVYKSQPLPLPEDIRIFESNLNFTFIVES